MNEQIIKTITSAKFRDKLYPQYFSPEIKPFINEKFLSLHNYDPNKEIQNENKWIEYILNDELPENFNENRKIGENENYLCELIRNDSIKEFITYINKSNHSLHTAIKRSIYETNELLLKEFKNFPPNIIKYACFYGSIQIFQYLIENGVRLTKSLWIYAIHGQNQRIIDILEENFHYISSDCIIELIKSHHNDTLSYIQNNVKLEFDIEIDTLKQSFKFFNFKLLPIDDINEMFFSIVANMIILL